MNKSSGFDIRWFNSLRFKIPLIFLVLFLLIIASIFFTLHVQGQRLPDEIAYAKITRAGLTVVDELKVRTATATTLASSLASLAETLPSDINMHKRLIPRLLNIQGTEHFIAGGGIWPAPYQFDSGVERRSFFWGRDRQGKLRYYDDYNAPKSPGYHREEWYVPARYLASGHAYWSKSYIAPYSLQPMVTVTVPMHSAGKFTGAATVDLKLEGLHSLLEKVTRPFAGYAFAVDRNGTFLTFPDEQLARKTRPAADNTSIIPYIKLSELAAKYSVFSALAEILTRENQLLQTLAQKTPTFDPELAAKLSAESYQIDAQEARLITASLSNPLHGRPMAKNFLFQQDYFLQQPVFVSVITMPGTFWRIITVMPYSAALHEGEEIFSRLLQVMLLAVFLALLFITVLTGKALFNPIHHLARQLQRIAADSTLQTRLIQTDDRGELGALAYWFNHRTRKLLDTQRQLGQAHSELEQRVAQRTRELLQSNQQLQHEIKAHRQTENIMLENKMLLSEAQAMAHIGSWRWNMLDNKMHWSDETYRICGLQPQSLAIDFDLLVQRIVHPDDVPILTKAIDNSIEQHIPFGIMARVVRPDGKIRFVYNQGQISYNEAGQAVEMAGTTADITEQVQIEAELRLSATTFETHEAILITDEHGNILKVNKAFTDITGYTAADVLGRNPRLLNSGRHNAEFYKDMWRQLLETGRYQGEIWNRRKNGEIFPQRITITAAKDREGRTTNYISVFSDITEQKTAEAEIRSLAFYDPLTGLPNRRLLLDRIGHEIVAAQRHRQFGALLFLDIDRFKLLNDALGHEIGDELLVQVAQILQHSLREEDTASRLGGDEFVILLPGRNDSSADALDQALTVAEKIHNVLDTSFDLHGHEHYITLSIGIAVFPDTQSKPQNILKQADTAMYQAKAEGRNRICFFRPEMQKRADIRLRIEKELRVAIAQNELHLVYQPQIDSAGRCHSAEALLRWQHAKEGFIAPDIFIVTAEESGLILPLGEWVLDQACAQLRQWLDDGLKLDHLAINVSPRQFRQKNIIDIICRAIEKHAIDPSLLTLEITEGIVIDNIDDTIAKMSALKKIGIGIAIDDFGTGYSSLTYLKQLPLDQLKIDRSFVRDIIDDVNDAVIVETIIAMANHLGISIIAEGVETEQQRQFLMANGCKLFQGYYLSKPLTAGQFSTFLRNRQ